MGMNASSAMSAAYVSHDTTRGGFAGHPEGLAEGQPGIRTGKNTPVYVPECEMQMVIDSILLNYSSTHKFYTYLHLTAIQKLTLNPKVRVQRLIRINPQPVYS